MIRAVLIDIDNTLLDFTRTADVAMQRVALSTGVKLPDNISEIFHPINDMLWKEIENGTLTRDELHRTRWARIFRHIGLDADGEEFERLFVEEIRNTAVPVKGAMALLDYLKPLYPLYVASNAHADQQRNRLRLAGMIDYFDGMFLSEEIGAEKPSRDFFEACMTTLAPLSPDEVVMIGDSIRADIAGAKDYGITTVWYNPTSAPRPDDVCPDYTVEDLRDIRIIL